MLLIPCPWCGPRDEIEFRYGGEAHIPYPSAPQVVDDATWGAYLFIRDNPKGRFRERWRHTAGCRRWFNVLRDTATNEVLGSYRLGEAPPTTAEPPAGGPPPAGPG